MEVINTFFASFSLIDNWESILAIAIVYLLPLLFIFVMSLEIDDLPSTIFIFHFLANLCLCIFVLPEHYVFLTRFLIFLFPYLLYGFGFFYYLIVLERRDRNG